MNQETGEGAETRTQDRAGAGTPPGDKTESGSRRKPGWILILIPVILAVAGYWIYQTYFADRESTDDAQIDGHINPVAAKVSGHVVSINVEDNQFVKAGIVIVQIDPRDYKVSLEKARADLAAAQSAAEAAHTQVPMTSTTTSSQSNLAGAGIELAEGARAAAMKDVDSARARLESTLVASISCLSSKTKLLSYNRFNNNPHSG